MRYLAILVSVLMLAACETPQQRQAYRAIKSDCRMQGYIPGTVEFDDCYRVGKHNYDLLDMQMRVQQMQAWSAMGGYWSQQRTGPVTMPQPVAPKTQFCYPGQGFVYCQ